MKTKNRQMADSLVNGFNLEQWRVAEQESFANDIEPQPKGSLTVEQFAKLTNRSTSRAQTVLATMCKTGHARNDRWRAGKSGQRKVYWLIKK